MIRVLHVVDRTTGGVPVAVSSYISNSPAGIEHHILSPFDGGAPAPVWTGVQAHMHDLGPGTVRRLSRIRRVARAVTADVIHAHSSFAGLYARLAASARRRRIVYTPHCFAFEREDISPAARGAYRAVEWVLVRNTSLIAACSPSETEAARRLDRRTDRAVFVPNVPLLPRAQKRHDATVPLVMGMLGRVSPQKDPEYFAAQVRMLRDITSIEACWIGEGNASLTGALSQAGIHLTGWLDPEQAAMRLDGLDLYLHSAAWEGFPLAVLDANARGLPILVRAIPAFHGIDAQLTIEAGMGALATALKDGSFPRWAESNVRRWNDYLAPNNCEKQRSALARVWLSVKPGGKNTETSGEKN